MVKHHIFSENGIAIHSSSVYSREQTGVKARFPFFAQVIFPRPPSKSRTGTHLSPGPSFFIS